MTEPTEQWKQDTQRRTAKYTSRLMNNSKWREVLTLLLENNAVFEVALIHDESYWRQVQHLTLTDLATDYIKAPGIGGPCLYAEIFAIKLPLKTEKRNPQIGKTTTCQQQSAAIIKQLNALGKLPLSTDENYCTLQAYQV